MNLDLSNNPPCIVMMGNTTGHYNEGYAHPNSKHKIVTVLVGFSREWPYERGKLRILRSSDREDYEFEYAPVFGAMLNVGEIPRLCRGGLISLTFPAVHRDFTFREPPRARKVRSRWTSLRA